MSEVDDRLAKLEERVSVVETKVDQLKESITPLKKAVQRSLNRFLRVVQAVRIALLESDDDE